MSNDTYLVPDLKKGEIHRTELTIKKSRFITSIARTHGVDEAKAFIDKVTLMMVSLMVQQVNLC